MNNQEKKLIEEIQKRGYRGELFILRDNCTQILFEDHFLSYVKEGENKGCYLRLIDREGRMGQISFTIMDDNKIEEIINNCIISAQFQKKTNVEFERSGKIIEDSFFDKAFSDISGKDLILLGNGIIEQIKSVDRNIKGPIYLEKNEYEIEILTSENAYRSFKKGRFSLEIEGKLSKEGDLIQFNKYYSHGRRLPDTSSIGDSLREDYANCANIVSIPSGRYTVILDPEIFEDISRPVEALFNGRNIKKKTSSLWDKRGKQIFDSQITMADKPDYPFLENSVPFDDEGVASSGIMITEKGSMSNILLDKESSKLLGMSNNGRGFKRRALLGGRTYNAVPQPSITNLFLNGGSLDKEGIFNHSGKAVYIKSLMGTILGHHISGYVSGNVWLGFLVESGEITGRIKDVVFSIDILDVLRNNVAGLSKEVFFNKNFSAPFILLEDIQLTSK